MVNASSKSWIITRWLYQTIKCFRVAILLVFLGLPSWSRVTVDQPDWVLPYRDRKQWHYFQIQLIKTLPIGTVVESDYLVIPGFSFGLAIRPWVQIGLNAQLVDRDVYFTGIRVAFPYLLEKPFFVPFGVLGQGGSWDKSQTVQFQGWQAGFLVSLFTLDDTGEAFLKQEYGLDAVFIQMSRESYQFMNQHKLEYWSVGFVLEW